MYIAVDVGGTKTLLAILSSDGAVKHRSKFATSHDYQQFLTDLATHLANLGEHDYQAAGVAVPGALDRQHGIGLSFGNLPWLNVPLSADLSKIFDCPVVVENDAKAGGLNEALNIINEFKNVLYIPIGTGIGISFTKNGAIDLSIADLGGAILRLQDGDVTDSWDHLASGHAIVATYGQKAQDITDPAIWKKVAHRISLGLVELIPRLSPDVIVIGGGVGVYLPQFKKFLEEELRSQLPEVPPLRQAHDPATAVLYGCYDLIKTGHGQTTS